MKRAKSSRDRLASHIFKSHYLSSALGIKLFTGSGETVRAAANGDEMNEVETVRGKLHEQRGRGESLAL